MNRILIILLLACSQSAWAVEYHLLIQNSYLEIADGKVADRVDTTLDLRNQSDVILSIQYGNLPALQFQNLSYSDNRNGPLIIYGPSQLSLTGTSSLEPYVVYRISNTEEGYINSLENLLTQLSSNAPPSSEIAVYGSFTRSDSSSSWNPASLNLNDGDKFVFLRTDDSFNQMTFSINNGDEWSSQIETGTVGGNGLVWSEEMNSIIGPCSITPTENAGAKVIFYKVVQASDNGVESTTNSGGYSLSQIADMRYGSKMVGVSNNIAKLRFQVDVSTNLTSEWLPHAEIVHEIDMSGMDVGFFRVRGDDTISTNQAPYLFESLFNSFSESWSTSGGWIRDATPE